jgi:hypothetical protein
LKQEDALSPLLSTFASDSAIKRVQEKQEGLKLNSTPQPLVYADDLNILGGSTGTIKKNTKALADCNNEIGLEVTAEKTKYIVMSRDQKAGHNHNIKLGNKSSDRVEHFKYLGITLMYPNSIDGESKGGLISGILCRAFCLPACYPKI